MAPVKVPTFKWNKPPTAVYENNYGYGINFYQPMIDYMNAKEQGIPVKPPHLPWNNERALDKYRFDRPIKTYTEEEVHRISHDIADQAKRDLNTFKITKRSPFSVIATASAANVTKHVGTESVTTKAKKKKVDREKIKAERQKKRLEEIERELELYEKEVNVGAELRGKAMMYRGKSAGAIAQVLLDESRRNVAEGRVRKMDTQARKDFIDKSFAKTAKSILSDTMTAVPDIRHSGISQAKFAESVSETVRTIRETSPATCIVHVRTEVPIIDDSYVEKVRELKETLNEFDQLNTSFLMHNRYLFNIRLFLVNFY